MQGNIQKAVQASLAKIGNTDDKKQKTIEAPKTTAIKEVKQLSEKKSESRKNESDQESESEGSESEGEDQSET